MGNKKVTKIDATIKPASFDGGFAKKRKVAAYARVSTTAEEQETSLDAQRDYYEQFIKENKNWEFVGVYYDDGISGLSFRNRDGFNRINECFYFYNSLEQELQQCVDQQMPLNMLAEVLGTVIQKPIYVQGSEFKVLVRHWPKIKNPPADYLAAQLSDTWMEGQNVPEDEIKLLAFDEAYRQSENVTVPTIWPGTFDDNKPTMYLNVFIEQRLVARILIDPIPNDFCSRDYILIQLLAKYLKKPLLQEQINLFNRPKDMEEILTGLLSHRLLPEHQITSVLMNYGWKADDKFFCGVMKLIDKDSDLNTLNPIALNLSKELISSYYTIFNNSIVFVCNLSRNPRSRRELIDVIKPTLRDNLITASFSTIFRDFKNLYYYYNQALTVGKLGTKK